MKVRCVSGMYGTEVVHSKEVKNENGVCEWDVWNQGGI